VSNPVRHAVILSVLAILVALWCLPAIGSATTEPGATTQPSKAEQLAQWLEDHSLGPIAVVIIIAMLPIFELRGAIPVAILYFKMPWYEAYVWSVIGNMIPIIPIILLIGPVSGFLMRRSKLAHRFFTWVFERSRKRGADLVEKYEAIGLGIFVAIPLPVTGAWTGSLLAFLMRIRARRAFPCVFCGVLTAGVVVTLVTLFARGTLSFLLNM
jgi:uncharacterized membrane protein